MKESPSVSARWRADAVVLRRYGCRRIASILEHCADEIDKEIGQDRYVDLAEAKALTGYTRGHLRRLMRGNTLPNHGTEAAPRFLVSELPRKPGLQRGAVPGAASPARRPPEPLLEDPSPAERDRRAVATPTAEMAASIIRVAVN